MYAIKGTYHYYSNTYGAPENGFLRMSNGQVKGFASREEALEYLEERYGKMMLATDTSKNTYMKKGRYVLNHGEYSEPRYTIVKYTRKK